MKKIKVKDSHILFIANEVRSAQIGLNYFSERLRILREPLFSAIDSKYPKHKNFEQTYDFKKDELTITDIKK